MSETEKTMQQRNRLDALHTRRRAAAARSDWRAVTRLDAAIRGFLTPKGGAR